MFRIGFTRFVPALIFSLLAARQAEADWPVARHDPGRTATASASPASITKPTVYWRTYLGGSLTPTGHLAVDVNQDGKVEVVYAAGGKVIAKLPDDTVVWESPAVEISSLVGIADVNGDKVLDVVAYSSRKAFVISGKTGAIEWEEAEGEMGTIGAVRMGDLDRDGLPDLYIEECGCCGVNSGIPGVAYSFGKGFGVSTPLWTAPAHGGCNGRAVTLGDFDGDGHLEVAVTDVAGVMWMLSGPDGKELAKSSPLGSRKDIAYCDTANVDGRPGDELVCYQSDYQAAGGSAGHHVWAATYDAAATPKITVLWERSVDNVAAGQVRWMGNSLVDLDQDGKLEVVVGEYDGTAWALKIYDAANGTELAALPAEVLRGIVDLDGDARPEILTSAASTGHLLASKFNRYAATRLAPFWTLSEGQTVLARVDWAKVPRNSTTGQTLAIDLDGDKVLELVLYTAAKDQSPAVLTAYKAGSNPPTAVASYVVPDGITLLTYQVFGKVSRPYDQLLLTRSDGYLVILDQAFVPTKGTSDTEFPVPGLRIGGYYSGAYGFGQVPIAPRLGAAGDSVVVRDSRGTLLRIDPQGASLVSPPKVVWELPGAASPTAVQGLDSGKPGLVCSKSGLSAFSAEGKPLWSKSLPGGLYYDALPGDADGDGAPDLFVEHLTAGSVGNFQVLSGKDGHSLWAAPHSEPFKWGGMPFAVSDYDGDGRADLFTVLNTLRVLRGADGTKLAENPQFLAYFLPVIADVDHDGIDDVTLTGGYYPARTYAHDLTSASWTGADDRPYPYGARAECPSDRSVWVQASLQEPGLVRFITMNGTDAGSTASLFLAEGALFADGDQAQAAKKHRGTVGNATIKPNLTGPGTHPSALLGSTDGWLYALNACDGTLDWSYKLGFPVGESILGDTSGDGVDEIILTAADGYLYALQQQHLPAPAYVYDTDPPAGITDQDVDETLTYQMLHGKWAAVPGADSYEVAVLTAGGSYVTQPNWQNVGQVTWVTVRGLPLQSGKRYVFAVRAVSSTKGSSTETASDGVLVTVGSRPASGSDAGAPVAPSSDAGAPGKSSPSLEGSEMTGCSCSTGGGGASDPCALAFAVLGGILFRVARGRRGRGRS
jgi:outer membrane protein assembly factor BamB